MRPLPLHRRFFELTAHRTGQAGPYTAQITGFLHAQSGRMQKAAETAHKRRDEDASRKRSHIADVVEQQSSSKRRKIGSSITSFADAVAPVAAADQTTDAAASFDVTTLPVNIVIELIIANLQAVPSARLASAIDVSNALAFTVGIFHDTLTDHQNESQRWRRQAET